MGLGHRAHALISTIVFYIMKSELRASQRNCACKSLEHLLLFSVQSVLSFFLLSLFLERGGGGLLIFCLFVCFVSGLDVGLICFLLRLNLLLLFQSIYR